MGLSFGGTIKMAKREREGSFTVYYHTACQKFTGRAEPIVLMLEYSGADYECQTPDKYPAGSWPTFAPPMIQLRDGTLVGQTAAITCALARELGLAPKTAADEAHALQVALNAADILSESGGKTAERTQKWLDVVEGCLTTSGSGYLVGDTLSYADLHMFAFIQLIEKKHPEEFAAMEKVTKWYKMVGELPGVKEFKAKGIPL